MQLSLKTIQKLMDDLPLSFVERDRRMAVPEPRLSKDSR